jgi:hypothetical protein
VQEVLGRAYALFGAPEGGAVMTDDGDARWADARDRLDTTRRQMTGVSGALAHRHAGFTHDAARDLGGAAATDTRLAGQPRGRCSPPPTETPPPWLRRRPARPGNGR